MTHLFLEETSLLWQERYSISYGTKCAATNVWAERGLEMEIVALPK
jgi:hypothetical protein